MSGGIVPHALRRLREVSGQDAKEAAADRESMRATFKALMGLCPEPSRVVSILAQPMLDDYPVVHVPWPDPAGELLRVWRDELDQAEDVAA